MILRESQKRQIRRTPYNGRVRELGVQKSTC